MADLDPEQHQVVFRIAVIGGVGQRFLELINAKDGELELPAVAGYHPRFIFQVFPDDPWAGDANDAAALEQLVPNLDALVFTDDFAAGTHYSAAGVERLSKTLAPLKLHIPSAVFGGPALAEEWGSLSGVPVLHVADPRGEDALSIVKALVKALLRSSIRSTPPPPPAT
jgi:hypothetical protein